MLRTVSLFLLLTFQSLEAVALITMNGVYGEIYMSDAMDEPVEYNDEFSPSPYFAPPSLRQYIPDLPTDYNPGDPIPAYIPELPYSKQIELQSTNLSNQMDIELRNNNDGTSFSFNAGHTIVNNLNPNGEYAEGFTFNHRPIRSIFNIGFTAEQDSRFTIKTESLLDGFTTLPTVNDFYGVGPGFPIVSSIDFYQSIWIYLFEVNTDEVLFSADTRFGNAIIPDIIEGELFAGSQYGLVLSMSSDVFGLIPIATFSEDDYELSMDSTVDIEFSVTAVPLPPAFALFLFALSGLTFSLRR